MKVYAVIRDDGYDGHSPPLGIYSSEKLARIAVAGALSMLVHQYELDVPSEDYGVEIDLREPLLDAPNVLLRRHEFGADHYPPA